MATTQTSIIPKQQTFVRVDGSHYLNYKAICVFAATGFFWDDDTYWTNVKCLKPASIHTFDSSNHLTNTKPWFNWHYSPRAITFDQALDEYVNLFETIIHEQTQGRKVILPLSGGLDSRTQAAALKHINADVFSYSYEFDYGYKETKIAKQIAESCSFDFKAYTIKNDYLWDVINELTDLNHCYSDFTSPRQMAIYNEFDNMGDLFSLGHWGDVLFDDMKVDDHLKFEEQVEIVIKKLLKRGGLHLAEQLWKNWTLEGNFYDYFYERIKQLLKSIAIEHSANARIRAFKSLYWAPRWTSVNLSIFEAKHDIALPYYDDRMCQFICTIPEAYLKNRQLQIAYIKKRSPQLAKITWQDHRPFNLTNFTLNKLPYNIPYKAYNKAGRVLKSMYGKNYVQRNWELQFSGMSNEEHLKHYLLHNGLESFISKGIISNYYNNFVNSDSVQYAHGINMLLVLSKFNQLYTSTSSV